MSGWGSAIPETTRVRVSRAVLQSIEAQLAPHQRFSARPDGGLILRDAAGGRVVFEEEETGLTGLHRRMAESLSEPRSLEIPTEWPKR